MGFFSQMGNIGVDYKSSSPSFHGKMPLCGRMLTAALFCIALSCLTLCAQDLEPRAYSSSPLGTNFLVLGYSRSSGGVVFDPTIPVEDVNSSINGLALGYFRTVPVLGRLGNISAALPYAEGSLQGKVAGEPASIRRSGLADPRFRFAINLLGAKPLRPGEFSKYRQKTTLGASLSVNAPLGQYDPARLINLGNNRWAFKPELGLSHAFNKLVLDIYGGVWLLTDNHQYYPGSVTRHQDPIRTFQAHLSYGFRPGLWAALDATYYTGGQAFIDGLPKGSPLGNSRLGATLALPLAPYHSLKVAYSTGATTRIGTDFRTFSVSYQYLWFDKH